MNTKYSAQEFAQKHGVDYATATGFLKFLKKKGLATDTEKRPQSSGKGKPTTMYEVQTPINLDI